jgi:hypothetical protein
MRIWKMIQKDPRTNSSVDLIQESGATPNTCTYSLDLVKRHSVSMTEHLAISIKEYLIREIE